MADNPYSLAVTGLLFCFIVFVVISGSPVLETAGRAMFGAFGSGIGLIILAVWNWQAFKAMVPLVASVLGCMLCIAVLMAWLPGRLARRRAYSEARKQFPMASENQLRYVVSQILIGSRITSFGWVDGEIIFGRGQHAIKCGTDGRRRNVHTRPADYYQPEEQALFKAIPSAQTNLSEEHFRQLCMNLYFNWSIDSFDLQEDHLSVTLSRRNETLTKRYALAAAAQAAN